MKNILCDYSDLRLPPRIQLRRVRRVMAAELTGPQREILEGIYFQGKRQSQLARERGVSRSTVCRTLHRAEERLRRFLRY